MTRLDQTLNDRPRARNPISRSRNRNTETLRRIALVEILLEAICDAPTMAAHSSLDDVRNWQIFARLSLVSLAYGLGKVATNDRISRSTSSCFEANMYTFAPTKSTTRAAGTAVSRSCFQRA